MAPTPPNSGKAGRSNNSSENGEEQNLTTCFKSKQPPVENDTGDQKLAQNETAFNKGDYGNFAGNCRQSARVAEAQATKYVQQAPEQNLQLTNLKKSIIQMNCEFQHLNSHAVCKNIKLADCQRCEKAWELYSHQTVCSLDQCSKCSFLKLIVEYHKGFCQSNCNLCSNKLLLGPQENSDQVVDGNEEGAAMGPVNPGACGTSSLDDNQAERVVAVLSSEGFSQKLVGECFVEGEDYEIAQKLGQGGNGHVFAVKLLPRGKKKLDGIFRDHDLAVKKATVSDEEIRILREVSCLSCFVPHYFLINKEEKVEWKDRKHKTRLLKHRMFIAKCDKSLSQHLKENTQISHEEAMTFCIRILFALCHLHYMKIMHKDVKAGNILLINEVPKLADFEYAVKLDGHVKTEDLQSCGTQFFMSREVKEKKAHGLPADIHGFGALCLETIFGGDIKDKGGYRDKNYLIKKLKDLDLGLGEMVESCLQDNPDSRPSALELLQSPVVQRYINDLQLFQKFPELRDSFIQLSYEGAKETVL